MSYKIAAPDEYLAVTGMGISTVRITKAAWVWPFQRCRRFSVQPHDYGMNLQAMTKEKLQFLLPVVFTVGPDVNNRGANAKGPNRGASADAHNPVHDEDKGDALVKYAMLLAQSDTSGAEVHGLDQIIKGIIEGETRVLVSSMTMEEVFGLREEFKKRIFKNIQGELDQFGLKIYNANVKELRDAEGSSYFQSLSQKAHEGATNQARIDVAEARLRGTVGESQRKGQQDRELAKINAQTAVEKTDRDVERAAAESNLATRKTAFDRDVEIAKIEAMRATQSRDEDLKKEVELKRAGAELERLRATDVVKASIARESKQQAADAKAYEVLAEAKAAFEKSNRITDATAYKTRQDADATADAAIRNAEAGLQARRKEAEGLCAMAEAYGKMAQAFGGPQGLLSYMMIEKGTYVELAKANAAAVRGMEPKISVWNTGAEAGTGGDKDSAATMRNVYQMLPPLMTTINEQTGITLPEWQFGRMATERTSHHDAKGVNGTQYL